MASPMFDELDLQYQESHGLLQRGTDVHRVHKRRLTIFSESEYEHIPLDIDPDSPEAKDAFVPIPTHLFSAEALRYMGFSAAKSREIWAQWENWPSTGILREVDPDNGLDQVEFIDFATGHLARCEEPASDSNRKWRACLRDQCGLNLKTIKAIMDPFFAYLRLGDSCIFWAKDTILMRYHGLLMIQRTSRERGEALRRAGWSPESDQESGQDTPSDEETTGEQDTTIGQEAERSSDQQKGAGPQEASSSSSTGGAGNTQQLQSIARTHAPRMSEWQKMCKAGRKKARGREKMINNMTFLETN